MRLRPVTFRYKDATADGAHPIQYGLIAEEVAEVNRDLVVYERGRPGADREVPPAADYAAQRGAAAAAHHRRATTHYRWAATHHRRADPAAGRTGTPPDYRSNDNASVLLVGPVWSCSTSHSLRLRVPENMIDEKHHEAGIVPVNEVPDMPRSQENALR